jgi:hypothetical protein
MKRSLVVTIALALPVGLAAQQPSAPLENPVTAAFRGRTLNFQRNLAQAFDSIPESMFSYKPTPAQLTVGYVAQHLADDNYFFCNEFGGMKATRPEADTTTADSVKATWPKARLVSSLKESFAFCERALDQLNDVALAEQITLTMGGRSRNLARVNLVLGHVVDMADHYSQIANYMRLNNLLPPTALPRPRPGGN